MMKWRNSGRAMQIYFPKPLVFASARKIKKGRGKEKENWEYANQDNERDGHVGKQRKIRVNKQEITTHPFLHTKYRWIERYEARKSKTGNMRTKITEETEM